MMANMVKLQYKSYMFLDLKYVWSLSFQFSNNQDPQHKIYMDCVCYVDINVIEIITIDSLFLIKGGKN